MMDCRTARYGSRHRRALVYSNIRGRALRRLRILDAAHRTAEFSSIRNNVITYKLLTLTLRALQLLHPLFDL